MCIPFYGYQNFALVTLKFGLLLKSLTFAIACLREEVGLGKVRLLFYAVSGTKAI